MQKIKTPILPVKQQFVKIKTSHELDYKAICVFLATGFFMRDDTYWRDEKCLLSGHIHDIDSNGYLNNSEPWFKWHYTPRDISFETALEEYIELLTTIIKEQIGDSAVILPLSGGLDSRSQALVLKELKNSVHAFSYSFKDGFAETDIARKIAKSCGFSFQSFEIERGYLWGCIDELAKINGCYSEFTHPRQMAVLEELKQMQGLFSLGHWGDVLFDRGVPEQTQEADVVPLLMKKMVKSKGLKLANCLWQIWDLEGNLTSYLRGCLESDLAVIKIDNLSAKVRAYKTSQWAHRWTTTNIGVFGAAHQVTLPYYDDRMCQFICSVPEAYLSDRRLQIAHLRQDEALSNITWQQQNPYNLNNFHYNRSPYNLPHRLMNKLNRVKQDFSGRPYVQRNWELQFLGSDNAKQLEQYLFNKSFNKWVPKGLIEDFYKDFKQSDAVAYSHAISMLLTLSVWHNKNTNIENY